MRRLEHVAEAVKLGETKEDRKRILRDRLKEIVLPTAFKLPLNPHLTVRWLVCISFIVDFLTAVCLGLWNRRRSMSSDGIQEETIVANVEECVRWSRCCAHAQGW